jgi:hypothetical protein
MVRTARHVPSRGVPEIRTSRTSGRDGPLPFGESGPWRVTATMATPDTESRTLATTMSRPSAPPVMATVAGVTDLIRPFGGVRSETLRIRTADGKPSWCSFSGRYARWFPTRS